MQAMCMSSAPQRRRGGGAPPGGSVNSAAHNHKIKKKSSSRPTPTLAATPPAPPAAPAHYSRSREEVSQQSKPDTGASSSHSHSSEQQQQHTADEEAAAAAAAAGVVSEEAGNSRDCTLLPAALNDKFDQLDADGAVRPVILSVGTAWEKRSQKALLAAPATTTLHAGEQKTERSAAFDLLDALSRSGGLVVDNTDLHVVLVSTHCFDKTLMNTIIQQNTNPIEKMEQSTLIMASVIHGRSVQELSNESQHKRLQSQAAMLFEED